MKPLSTRLEGIKASGSREIIKLRGPDTLYLSTGTIDFETFEHIHEAAIKAIKEGFTAYTNNQGMPELREAIADKLANDNGIQYNADEILVTSGSSEALGAIPQAVMEPGDEAIMFDPHYVGGFKSVVQLASGVPVILPTFPDNNWNPDPEQVEKAITLRTKLLFMVSPSNPVGSLLDAATVDALCDIAIRHDLYVVADELYEKITFDGKRVISPASKPGMRERTFTVNGFSKGYGMTGWRVGYVACPHPLIEAVRNAQNYVGICAPSISQVAALAALQGPPEMQARMLAELQRRRDFVVERLNSFDGINCTPQDGTFYSFADAREFMKARGQAVRAVLQSELDDYEVPASASVQFCDFAFARGNVYISPGGAFGASSEGWFRISEADRMEKLERGLDAIETALTSI